MVNSSTLITLKKDSIIIRVIDYFLEHGIEISSEMLVDNYLANDFEKYASAALGVASRVDIDGTALFTEKNFWSAFLSDIQSAKKLAVCQHSARCQGQCHYLQHCGNGEGERFESLPLSDLSIRETSQYGYRGSESFRRTAPLVNFITRQLSSNSISLM